MPVLQLLYVYTYVLLLCYNVYICIQRQQEEEVNKLTLELAMKQKEIIRLEDDNRAFIKENVKSKESEKLETTANKVHTYIYAYISIPTYLCLCNYSYIRMYNIVYM